ncbi:MAG: acetylornithine deacetylase [Rhodospirillaceae bacterium]|nr:acetylornithine deacetylase [Rhodospirillaceae bacterium]
MSLAHPAGAPAGGAATRLSPRDMLARLVAFDTTSVKSNLALIDFVRDYLAQFGVASRLVFDDTRSKANLYASIDPPGRSGEAGGVVLSGHTDVVPVAGQPWSSDPFSLRESDGRLYGRGTSDMKGFIALALALVPEMQAASLRRPIHLALSYDEEVGCLGAPRLLADIRANLPLPAIAIIGEPTRLKLGNRHKGCYSFDIEITGRDGHSSGTHRGVNAISHAAAAIDFLDSLADRFRREGPFDDGFDPPYTTVNVGEIQGGTAVNIIPRRCTVGFEFRPIPATDPAEVIAAVETFLADELQPRMRARAPEAEAIFREGCVVPPLVPRPGSQAETLVRRLTGANEAIGLAFATEAGQFQEIGIDAVVCGPGSIEQAHQPDEFIELAQLAEGEAFLRRLIAWAAE